jgi:hypothetical protein
MQWHILRQRFERESLRNARENEQERMEWEFWKHARESDMWQHLRGKFEVLADEERTILRGKPGADCGLRAYCIYNSDVTPAESDLVRQGLVCLLYRSATGTWSLSEGPNEYFKARLEAVAARAGAKLDAPRGISPANYWLHCICVYLRKNDSPSLFARSDTGGIITRVCESSATFCCWLEKRAIELASATERNNKCGTLESGATSEPPSAEASAGEVPASAKRSRLTSTINCPSAARRMEAHLQSKGMNQTAFASQVGTTDRTLRSFRQTGKVRRDIFDAIAREMGTTRETLLKAE